MQLTVDRGMEAQRPSPVKAAVDTQALALSHCLPRIVSVLCYLLQYHPVYATPLMPASKMASTALPASKGA